MQRKSLFRAQSEDWYVFEHQIVEYVRDNLFPNGKVYHWENVPERELLKCKFISNFKARRENRIDHFALGVVPDSGLDGLIVDNGKYHGIQCKLYSSKVAASDIGSFLMQQQILYHFNKQESTGYLFTSNGITRGLADNFARLKDQYIHHAISFDPLYREKLIGEIKSNICEDEVNMSRRSYQKEILEEALQAFRTNKKMHLVLNITCALGKTVVSGDILKALQPKVVFCIAPVKTEVDNLLERIPSFLPNYTTLLFDSDNTTDLKMLEKKLRHVQKTGESIVIFTTYRSTFTKLYSLLFQGETCEDFVDDFTDDFEESDGEGDVITVKAAKKSSLVEFLATDAMLLMDEVHNISKNNTRLHHFMNFFHRAILCTATMPTYLKHCIQLDHVISKYGFAFALENKYIVDYRIWIPTLKTMDEYNGEVDVSIEDLKKYNVVLHQALFLYKAMLTNGSRRCIIYCPSKEACKAFNECWEQVGARYHGVKTWACRVNDDTPQNLRSSILKEFESGDDMTFKILTSCGCLDEAVNIVRCDSTFFTGITRETSEIKMYQRMNRASRLDPKNPLKVNNCYIWCMESAEVLQDALKRLHFGLKDPAFMSKVAVLDATYDNQELETVSNREQAEEKELSGLICNWVTLDERWQASFEKIKLFVQRNGSFPPVSNSKEGGAWIGWQRRRFILNILPHDKNIQLMTLQPWRDFVEGEGNVKVRKLCEYIEKSGKLPEARDKDNMGPFLHKTVIRLYEDEKLEEHYPGALVKLQTFECWKVYVENKGLKYYINNLEHIKQYVNKHGKVPATRDAENFGTWLNNQKLYYRSDTLKESDKKVITPEKLEILGRYSFWKEWQEHDEKHSVSYKPKEDKDVVWQRKYDMLCEYMKTHTKLPAQLDKTELSSWVKHQKEYFTKGTMVEEKKIKLALFAAWNEWAKTFVPRKKKE